MFAARYYPNRYYATRYWPPIGSEFIALGDLGILTVAQTVTLLGSDEIGAATLVETAALLGSDEIGRATVEEE